MRKYLAILITCIFFTLFITGCGEDEGVFRYTANGSYANQQLYLVMNDYYLWYYDVPQFNPTSYDNPSEVLEKMRFEGTYKNYQISDRWSFVMDYYEYVQFFEQGQYKGYGFMPIQGPNNNIWIAYLYDDSPLYSLGVKRGWKLEKIDNQTVTPNNYANLISISNEFTFRDHNDSIHKINIEMDNITINTVLMDTIYTINTKKIGYLVLESFIEKTEDELKNSLSFFSSEGIDELIIDLRYNTGGLVDVARYLANAITTSTTKGDVFIKYSFNDLHPELDTTEYFGSSDYDLGLNRLYVITQAYTASASEMLINSLKPYIDIIKVGGVTEGKPVGMFVYDYSQEYVFAPVVFETLNKNNEGRYFYGIEPDKYADDDITSDWGDTTENCLNAALYIIENGGIKKSWMAGKPQNTVLLNKRKSCAIKK